MQGCMKRQDKKKKTKEKKGDASVGAKVSPQNKRIINMIKVY